MKEPRVSVKDLSYLVGFELVLVNLFNQFGVCQASV